MKRIEEEILKFLSVNTDTEELKQKFKLTDGDLKDYFLKILNKIKTDDSIPQVFFDGAARGNPGPAGAGAVIKHKDEIINLNKFLGNKTNNYAEYAAVILAMEYLIDKNIDSAEFFGDSRLIVNQINGVFQVKNENLKELYNKVNGYRQKFKKLKFFLIKREQNKLADIQANNAVNTAV